MGARRAAISAWPLCESTSGRKILSRRLNVSSLSLIHIFQQNVELKPGLYFTSTIITLDDLLARLHGTAPVELSDGNILVLSLIHI